MKAISILNEALKNRDSIYLLSDSKLTEAIEEANQMQDKAQILLKAKYKQEIKELKLKFIEDISKLKDISWNQKRQKY